MFTLELYKSRDPAQPLRFTAPDNEEGVLKGVRGWLERNCPPNSLALRVNDTEWPHWVVIFEFAGHWFIAWSADWERRFPTFCKAQKAFTDACSYQVTACRG